MSRPADRATSRALVVVLIVLVALTAAPACRPGPPPILVRDLQLGWTWRPQPGPLTLGVTHTRVSLDPQDPPAALARGARILRDTGHYQDQHLMAFGTLNPEPSPDVYDWASLDRRMALIKRTGGQPVLTLAVAPDWMKGGSPGETDWSQVALAPTPENYDDFAELSARAVQRYPQVSRVLVWNELKGFFDPARNRWNYEGYTAMYNAVYDAVKAARPEVQVGGPYITMNSYAEPPPGFASVLRGPWGVIDQRSLDVVDYWLANARGADFVVVDGPVTTRDRGMITSPDLAAEKFAVVNGWLRSRTPLPIWWAEFYPESAGEVTATDPESAVSTLHAVAEFATSGAAVALLWRPQADDELEQAALWTDTADADGGRPTPLTAPWTWLAPRLRTGEVSVGESRSTPLTALRHRGSWLLVNSSDREIVLATRPAETRIPPWGTVLVSNGAGS